MGLGGRNDPRHRRRAHEGATASGRRRPGSVSQHHRSVMSRACALTRVPVSPASTFGRSAAGLSAVVATPEGVYTRWRTPAVDPPEDGMRFTQYYLDCLSQASYLIGDEASGQAVVVDPRRDVSEYLADAAAHGLTIIGVVNTHFHADFLAGHLELAAATGAWIGYGSRAEADYPIRHLARRRADHPRRRRRWRSGRPPATPRSRSACWSTSTPPTRCPTACSPGMRCSSATSGGPTCSPRWA